MSNQELSDLVNTLNIPGITKDDIDALTSALPLYDKLMDELKKTIAELEKFRKDYSHESAALIGDTKRLLMDGENDYFSASQNVYEWSGKATPCLEVYIKLFDKHGEEEPQKQRLRMIEDLDEGISILSDARNMLENSSRSFNAVGGKFADLMFRIDAEHNEIKKPRKRSRAMNSAKNMATYLVGFMFGKPGFLIAHLWITMETISIVFGKLNRIENFYVDLKTKVQTGATQIDDIKSILEKEVKQIGDLKNQIERAKSYVHNDKIQDVRDDVIQSVNELLTHCDDYRERHNSKTDLNL